MHCPVVWGPHEYMSPFDCFGSKGRWVYNCWRNMTHTGNISVMHIVGNNIIVEYLFLGDYCRKLYFWRMFVFLDVYCCVFYCWRIFSFGMHIDGNFTVKEGLFFGFILLAVILLKNISFRDEYSRKFYCWIFVFRIIWSGHCIFEKYLFWGCILPETVLKNVFGCILPCIALSKNHNSLLRKFDIVETEANCHLF
jgi:hypothetical protein